MSNKLVKHAVIKGAIPVLDKSVLLSSFLSTVLLRMAKEGMLERSEKQKE